MIPEPVMRELRYIEVATARKMRTLRVGPFTSRLRGQGFDFDELQPYRPGDEVRRIDTVPVLGTGKTDYKQLRALIH